MLERIVDARPIRGCNSMTLVTIEIIGRIFTVLGVAGCRRLSVMTGAAVHTGHRPGRENVTGAAVAVAVAIDIGTGQTAVDCTTPDRVHRHICVAICMRDAVVTAAALVDVDRDVVDLDSRCGITRCSDTIMSSMADWQGVVDRMAVTTVDRSAPSRGARTVAVSAGTVTVGGARRLAAGETTVTAGIGCRSPDQAIGGIKSPGDIAIEVSYIAVGRVTLGAGQRQITGAVTGMGLVAARCRWRCCGTAVAVVAIVSH